MSHTCLLFYYTLKSVYFFFTKIVSTRVFWIIVAVGICKVHYHHQLIFNQYLFIYFVSKIIFSYLTPMLSNIAIIIKKNIAYIFWIPFHSVCLLTINFIFLKFRNQILLFIIIFGTDHHHKFYCPYFPMSCFPAQCTIRRCMFESKFWVYGFFSFIPNPAFIWMP